MSPLGKKLVRRLRSLISDSTDGLTQEGQKISKAIATYGRIATVDIPDNCELLADFVRTCITEDMDELFAESF